MNMNMETKICNRVVKTLLDAGYTIAVIDGYETTVKRSTNIEEIMAAIQTTGEDYILAYKKGNDDWVWFVWGNGEDVITDHTTNLEEILKPVFEWIETLT